LPLTERNVLGTTTTAYNADSMITSIEDADGRVRDFSYDNLDRVTAEQWMSGGTVVATMSYAYNLDNALTSASDPNSAYAFAYNGDGEVTSVDNAGTPNMPDVVLSSTYDAVGDRTGLSATIAGAADFANSYTFNDDQQLTMVQQQGVNGGDIVAPKEVDYGYNAIGQFSSVADFNYIGVGPREDVLTGSYSYDTGARLTGIAYTSAGGTNTIDTLGWGYDAANNVTSFSSIDGTASYGYDATNQLTSASYTTASGGHQPANESFSFDANGNRNSTGYTTGSDNLMTSDGTFNYQHDADGNTTVRTRISNSNATDYQTTYTWDYRNRLTDVEYFDNNSVLTKHVHFVYDVFDHLIATEVDPNGGGTYTEVEHYVLDVSPEIPQAGVAGTALAQPVLQFDGSENLTVRYLVGPDPAGQQSVVAQEMVPSPSQGGPVIWAADDNLGTSRDLVDNTGGLANHRVFSAFGEDVYDSDPSLSYWVGFAGAHDDPNTGLVNDDHRWDDPATGRWLSEDPSGLGNANGDANLNRYTGNSPVDRTDPTGLSWLDDYSNWVQSWSPVNYSGIGETLASYYPGSTESLANMSDLVAVTGTAVVATGIVLGGYAAAPAVGTWLSGSTTLMYIPTFSSVEVAGLTVGGQTVVVGHALVISGEMAIAVPNAAVAAGGLGFGAYMTSGSGGSGGGGPSAAKQAQQTMNKVHDWIDGVKGKIATRKQAIEHLEANGEYETAANLKEGLTGLQAELDYAKTIYDSLATGF
jgi:RHS repeat-associated protein